MKAEIIIVFAATVTSLVLAQGWVSPGLQYNPIFNGQRNLTQYNPYFNNTSSGYGFWNFWNRIPFFGGRAYNPSPSLSCNLNYRQCNGSHSIFKGCPASWDRMLFSQCYVKPARWWTKREKIINYPRDFMRPGIVRNDTITAIRIWDQKCNGTGGYVHILPGGGVGHTNVTVRLYSDSASKGFNFCVQLYGRPNYR